MITIGIIIFTCLFSFLAFSNEVLFNRLCLYPYLMKNRKNEYFRFISVGFVHADIGHLTFNMLTLYFFGNKLEHIFGELQFVLFYFSALALSALPDYQKQLNNPQYKACGASGAVSSVLLSLVLFQPWGVVYIKFIIPVYFILFAAFYIIYSWHKSSREATDNIAHGVHLWGALYGLAFTLLVKPESLSMFLDAVTKPPFL